METIVTERKLSKELHICLDTLGFGRKRVWERIHDMNKSSRAKDISTKRILNTNLIEKIFVGSQREGIGYRHFNDLDILQINHGIICQKSHSLEHKSGKVVFELVEENAPAGYFFLKLASRFHHTCIYDKIKYALVESNSEKYLSSKLFMVKNDDVFLLGDGCISNSTLYKSPQGPSIPKICATEFETLKHNLAKVGLKESAMDYVRAFPCIAEWVLQAWCSRERKYNWPSKKTIAHVATLPAHVVPVGQLGSSRQDLQWRLCFTLAEIHLVQSFNNTQTKVFVLLKLIAKYFLKPSCKYITSYIMKTVVLWLGETIPIKKFRQKHLLARLYDGLKLLQQSVQTGTLPNYMIPERNMFAGNLQDIEQDELCKQINFLLHNGNRLISDFLNKRNESHIWVDRIFLSIYCANVIDKLNACSCAMLTSEGLAEYFTTAFLYKSKWNFVFDNIIFAILKVHAFGLSAIIPNDDTLDIPLNKQTGNDKVIIKDSTFIAVTNDIEILPLAEREPDLDNFIEEEKANQMTFSGIFQTCLMIFLLECAGHVGSIAGAKTLAYFIGDYVVCVFGYFLTVFLLVILTVYRIKRNSSKRTYIEDIGGINKKIKIYIPKTLHRSYILWKWVYYWVLFVFIIITGIKNPEVVSNISLGTLTVLGCCLKLLSQGTGPSNRKKIKPLDVECQSVVIQC